MWSSPLFTNTSKIQPPVEQFSQKTDGKWAEDLLYCTTEAACTVEHKLSEPAYGGTGTVATDFVGMHTKWHPRTTCLYQTSLRRNTERLLSLVLPTSHPSLELDVGWRGPGGHSHRGSQGPRRQHRDLHSCSYSTPTSQPQPRTSLGQTQWRGTRPQAASGQNCKRLHGHRFTVTTWAPLASALTSSETEHIVKGSRALLNPGDLEDRIMEITQSEQQTESQIGGWGGMKAIYKSCWIL